MSSGMNDLDLIKENLRNPYIYMYVQQIFSKKPYVMSYHATKKRGKLLYICIFLVLPMSLYVYLKLKLIAV